MIDLIIIFLVHILLDFCKTFKTLGWHHRNIVRLSIYLYITIYNRNTEAHKHAQLKHIHTLICTSNEKKKQQLFLIDYLIPD